MPIVPIVNPDASSTPEVQGTGVAPMHNYAPQQLEQLGQQAEGAGLKQMHVGAQIANRIQEQMDDANVNAAEAKFIQASTDILHGDKGYMNTQGADAINNFDGAQQALAKAKKDVEDSLGNDVQKHNFTLKAQRHLVTFGGQMGAHKAQQRKEYTYNEAVSGVESMRTMREQSEIGSTDHSMYTSAAVARMGEALKARGIAEGSDQWKKAERDVRTQLVGDDVTRLMTDNKYEEAKTLLSDQVKAGNVDPDAANKMRATIQSNVERVEVINTADKIFASRDGLEAKDLETLLGKVDEIKDPEQRQHVRSQVMSQFSQARSIDQQKYADNYSKAVDYKYSHHGSLRGMPPEVWGALDAKDRFELSKPPAIETDINTLYGFVTKPDTLTVDNVKAAWSKGLLSKESFISLTEHAMNLGKDKTYVQEAGEINNRIDYFANPEGVKTVGTMNDTQKADEIKLKYKVQTEIEKVKANQKGKITGEQVDKIIKYEVTQHQISLLRERSPLNPMVWLFGQPKNYTEQKNVRGYTIPEGTTGTMKFSDGKLHFTNLNHEDLGVAE
jgi:cell fate (sporulation/competence/biofilm development) regulator YmcA (YheA/YmcA/DUF963 family)